MSSFSTVAAYRCSRMKPHAQAEAPPGRVLQFPVRVSADADALLARAQDGESAALRALYQTHASEFIGFLVRICGNLADAEDIAQTSFVTTFERLHRVEPGKFRSFLYGVGIRGCYRLFRRTSLLRRLGFRSGDFCVTEVAGAGATPEQTAEVSRVLSVVYALPTEERIGWILRRLEGYTIAEAATLAGCSQATLRRRVKAADDTVAAHVEGGRYVD